MVAVRQIRVQFPAGALDFYILADYPYFMVTDFLKNVTEAIKNLKSILPKKSIPLAYVNMLSVAGRFAAAETTDLQTNLVQRNIKVDPKELSKFLERRYEFHIRNQIELFKHNK